MAKTTGNPSKTKLRLKTPEKCRKCKKPILFYPFVEIIEPFKKAGIYHEKCAKPITDVTKKRKARPHRHKWETDGESCLACGAYEAYCRGCQTVGLFNSKGKLIGTAN